MSGWLGQFHFIRPWLLLLVPAVAGVWCFWRSRSNPLRGWRAAVASLEALGGRG